MFSFFNKNSGPKTELHQALNTGALIIDVRSAQEYALGHIKGSQNIPLETLKNKIGEIKSYNRPVVTVCQSGRRSSTAQSFLQSNGIAAVNGGGWKEVNKIVPA